MNKKALFTLSFVWISAITFSQTDQQLLWGSYIGGNFMDACTGTHETPDGGQIIAGFTTSSSGISTSNSYQPQYGSTGPGGDGFFLKINADFSVEWVSYYGGERGDGIFAVDVNNDGDFLIAGETQSVNAIATADAYFDTLPGGQSGFIARFDADANRIWGTYFGGAGDEWTANVIMSAKFDNNDNIVVAGYTQSVDFPVTEGATQSDFGGLFDGFVSKFSPEGELIWSTYLGGPGNDRLAQVVVDSENNVIVYGETNSASGIATPGSHQLQHGGSIDIFLAKFSPDGELLWSTYFGGDGMENASFFAVGLSVDENDNLYINGVTESSTGIATPGAHDTEFNVPRKDFLARLGSNGEVHWSSYFGDYAISSLGTIAVVQNQLILTGGARFVGGVLMGNPFQSEIMASSNQEDIYMAGFTLDGEPLWGTYFGGTQSESFRDLAPAGNGRILLTGNSHSSNIPTTTGAWQTTLGGESDGYIAIFQIDGLTHVSETEPLSLSLFPNPARGMVRLNLPPEFAFRADVVVYNAVGQVVAQHAGFNALQTLPLNHPPGMYIVEARNGNRVARGKVVME